MAEQPATGAGDRALAHHVDARVYAVPVVIQRPEPSETTDVVPADVALADVVVRRMFSAGLQLSALLEMVQPHVAARLQAVVDDLDATIREVRAAVFASRDGPGRPGP